MRPQKRASSGSASGSTAEAANFKARKLLEQSELASSHRHASLLVQDGEGQVLDVKDSMMSRMVEKAVHKPMQLDSVSAEAMRRTMARKQDQSWHISALPVFSEDKRTLAKFRAPSSVREKLQEWLGSQEGQAWQEDRQALNANAEATGAV